MSCSVLYCMQCHIMISSYFICLRKTYTATLLGSCSKFCCVKTPVTFSWQASIKPSNEIDHRFLSNTVVMYNCGIISQKPHGRASAVYILLNKRPRVIFSSEEDWSNEASFLWKSYFTICSVVLLIVYGLFNMTTIFAGIGQILIKYPLGWLPRIQGKVRGLRRLQCIIP